MTRFKARQMFTFVSVVLLSGCLHPAALSQELDVGPSTKPPAFEHFITRDGARLYDGDAEFRFLSVNIPTLWLIEDDWSFSTDNAQRLPTEFEIRDVLSSARQLGGNVVRAYTIPVRNAADPDHAVTFVEAPGEFNEEAFRTMDLAIAIAAENNLRLVIPLVNNWPWHGGRPQYAAFRGKDTDAFCTDAQIREDFKATINFVINRTNTVTGVKYKDDPTIMAWETGNEMTCPAEWATDIARTIKAHAPKQLVVDGYHAFHMIYEGESLSEQVQRHSIDEPAIDLVSTHHYEENPAEMLANIKEALRLVDGKKALFVGEFGFMAPPAMEQVYDYIISKPDIPGGMIWSLRRHHENGGWLHHTEPMGAGLYRAYHWPGFDDGEAFGERRFLSLLRQKAYQIRGMDVPELPTPPAPKLFPIETVGAINWQGSVGASGYDIERAPSASGPWTQIAYNRDDIETPGFDLFSDQTAEVGQNYYYRILARNAAGISPASNVVGPVTAEYRTLVDRARGFDILAKQQGITVRSGDFTAYKEAFSRLHGGNGAKLIYGVPGTLRAVRIYAYEPDDKATLELSLSADGLNWAASDQRVTTHERHRELFPREYMITLSKDANASFLKLDFAGAADIVRVELDYE